MKTRVILNPQEINAQLRWGRHILATVWAATKTPTIETVEANARQLARAPSVEYAADQLIWRLNVHFMNDDSPCPPEIRRAIRALRKAMERPGA